MSLDVNLYESRISAYKVSGKEGIIDGMKKELLDNFLGNPSHEEVIISGDNRDVHIVSEGVRGYKLLCKPDEDIQAGEYVEWENSFYLCTFRFPDDKIQAKGTIQKCNHDLKWIDKNTGELIIKHCIEDGRTLYTTGIKDERAIDIPNGMVGIQLPYDEIVRKLNRRDEFIFNKTKYSLSFYDETTYEGLVVLICKEDEPSHLDDMVNEIADRWVVSQGGTVIDRLPDLDTQEPPEIEDEISDGTKYILAINTPYSEDNPDELWYGDVYEYVVVKLIDGVEVGSEFVFGLDSNELATIIDFDTNTCKITAKQSLAGGIANLIVWDTATDEKAIEKEIKIMGM